MEIAFKWISENYLEVFGTLTSIIYLYFSIRQKIWLWPLGLISSAVYVSVFFTKGIYADMGLQVYYVLISIYGWYVWAKANHKTTKNTKIQLVLANKTILIYLLLASVVLFILLSQILIHFTDSTIPYLDAFTTALGIVATWMLAKRYLEQWLIWIVVDAVSSGVYVYKELYFTVFLYLIYTVMAIVGYISWMKDFKMKVA